MKKLFCAGLTAALVVVASRACAESVSLHTMITEAGYAASECISGVAFHASFTPDKAFNGDTTTAKDDYRWLGCIKKGTYLAVRLPADLNAVKVTSYKLWRLYASSTLSSVRTPSEWEFYGVTAAGETNQLHKVTSADGVSWPTTEPSSLELFPSDHADVGYVEFIWVPKKTPSSASTESWDVGLMELEIFVEPLAIPETDRIVTFVDKDGNVIDTVVVEGGEAGAVAPEPPAYDGYKFYAWDKDFSNVREDMTVTALYHRLYTVTFVNPDETVLKTETVEETHDATAPDMTDRKYNDAPFKEWNVDFSNVAGDLTVTAVYYDMHTVTFVNPDGEVLKTESVADTFAAMAPDMTGKTYEGETFLGWEVEFSCITGDLTVTAAYGTVPDAVQAVVDAGTLPADALIWYDEANDVWDATTKNWYTPKGLITKWISGKTAVFITAGEVSVSGEKTVSGIIVDCNAPVTFTGGDLVFLDGGFIQYNREHGKARFECEVTAAGKLEQKLRPKEADVVTKLDEEVFLSVDEERKILPAGASLENVFAFTAETYYQSTSTTPKINARTITNSGLGERSEGIYDWVHDEATGTASCQIRLISWPTYWEFYRITGVKLLLREDETGVYARAGYIKTVLSPSSDLGVNIDFDALTAETTVSPLKNFGIPTLYGAGVVFDSSTYNDCVRIYGFTSTLVDVLPTDVTTEIAGPLSVGSELSVACGAFKTAASAVINAGNEIKFPISLGKDVVFSYGLSTEQTFSSEVKQISGTSGSVVEFAKDSVVYLGGRKGIASTINIYGDVTLSGKAYADGYERFISTPGAYVCDGGVLNVYQCYEQYGHSNAKVFCLEGGKLNIQTAGAFGTYGNQVVTLDGGEMSLVPGYEASAGKDTIFKVLNMKNGASITGGMMTWAWGGSGTYDKISPLTLNVSGSSPSSIDAEYIRFGFKDHVPISSSGQTSIQKIVVADVTENEEADLTVSSHLFLNTKNKWAEAASKEYCGIEKTGAGTVLFTGTNSVLAGSFKVKEGTVAFGTHASGMKSSLDGMALWMQGGTVDFGVSESDFTELKLDEDSAFVAKKGARITFTDSRDVEWVAGKQLLLSGDFGRKTFRIGTTGEALMPEQLAQIRCLRANGKTSAVRISGDGYLIPPWEGLNIILR